MAITTTEIDAFAKTAFFDNREWLNQENWQMYFGGSLPSGVIVKGKLESSGINYTSALSRYKVNSSYIQFRAGDIMANGIFAHYNGGFNIAAIASAQVDRFFVARVYLGAGSVKIVSMTKVAAEYGYTPTVFAKMLLDDESLCCTRNETYYDIPLLYEIFGGEAYDLRRLIYLPGKSPDVEIDFLASGLSNTDAQPGIVYGKYFVQAYGGMSYNIAFNSSDASTYFYVDPIPVCSEKPAIVKLVNNSSVSKEIRIPLLFKGMQYSYSWLENWTVDSNSRYIYKELVAYDKMTLILTPNSHEASFGYTVTNKSAAGGSVDPDDYYTKQEMSALLLLKANVTDVDDALALKEDKSALGDLAYQDTANYVTQITNKPTLGALAAKDKANLTTDVTGILPIANGGTGATDLAGIISNVFEGKTFYVDSNNGDDSNTGAQGHPFKTIQHAIDSCGYCSMCTIYVNGTFTENLYVPFEKIIRIYGSFTLSGYILVNGLLLLLSTNSIVISANYTRGAITAEKNGTVLIISNSNNNQSTSVTITNAYTGSNNNGYNGFGLFACNSGVIHFSDDGFNSLSRPTHITINAKYGIGAADGGKVVVKSSYTSISYTSGETYSYNGGSATKI